MMRARHWIALAGCLGITGLGAGCFVEPEESDLSEVSEDATAEAESALVLGYKSVMTYAKNAGLPCSKLVTAGAIAMAESGLNTLNTTNNPASSDCPYGSTDRGLWQINNCYWPYTDACAFDAACNAKAMASISSNGSDWTPWVAYLNGTYKQYLSAAQSAYNSGISGCTTSGSTTATCNDLGYTGTCVGKVSIWAENSTCKVRDCGAEGKTCGYISAAVGYGCTGGTTGATTLTCGTLGYTGKCMSNVLVWVQDGLCKYVNCSSTGRTCMWDGSNGYNCK
jgi:hypothetical protein